MADFYATYSASTAGGAPTTVTQGTNPWIVAGQGTAGVAATGVVTVQGITSGTPIPISGSITATNPSVSATGAAIPASATMIGGSDGTDLRAAKVSAAGLVSVDGSAVTQPVSGTVAVTQSTSPWVVSGTVTANAGTNLNTSLLALDATAAKLNVAQAGAIGSNTGPMVQGSVTTAAPTYTTATINPLSLTTAGALRTDASASTQPVSGTVAATQSGTWNIATVSTVTAVTAITNALPAGSNAIGGVTQSGTWTVQPGNTANTTAWLVDQATAAATFQDGAIAFGSLTTNYQTVVTTGGIAKIIQIRNNTNGVAVVSLDGGSTTSYTLDPGDAVSVDLKENGLSVANSTNLQAKYSGTAPTAGSIRINVVR